MGQGLRELEGAADEAVQVREARDDACGDCALGKIGANRSSYIECGCDIAVGE